MRPARLAALLPCLAGLIALAPAARAEDTPVLTLEVGTSRPLGGSGGLCDDLGVVSVTLGPQAVVTGLKPGSTTCSSAFQGGARRVVTVKVIAPPPPPKPDEPAPARPTEAPPPRETTPPSREGSGG
jgi:hypothetical protein